MNTAIHQSKLNSTSVRIDEAPEGSTNGRAEKRPMIIIHRVKRSVSQAGQGMTEYIMIIGLVALLIYAALQLFGKDIQGLFNKANSDLSEISNNAT